MRNRQDGRHAANIPYLRHRSLYFETSSIEQKKLLDQYKTLPAFADVRESAEQLRESGHDLYAFSNGSRQAVTILLEHAEILPLFDGVVSMEEVATYKPNPKGYRHFNTATYSKPGRSWMVSGNTFDVIGAAAYGMNTVWLKRNPEAVFDPMGFSPVLTIERLTELNGVIRKYLENAVD